MIKFFGPPLKEILSKTTRKVVFRFDTKGEFITDDPIIIDRAMGYFDYIELKAESIGNKVSKTYEEQPIIIETKQEPKEANEETKVFKCKQCEFETDNKGLLLAHYREHKK